jgi:hypothetical protein
MGDSERSEKLRGNPGRNKEMRDERSRRNAGRHMEFSKKPGMGSQRRYEIQGDP